MSEDGHSESEDEEEEENESEIDDDEITKPTLEVRCCLLYKKINSHGEG